MNTLVLACSLNRDSRSAELAAAAVQVMQQRSGSAPGNIDVVDLRETDLPFCDGDEAYSHPAVTDLITRVDAADAILMAVPIYNYDANAAAKNVIELTGRAWTGKLVGFLCAAGGRSGCGSVPR